MVSTGDGSVVGIGVEFLVIDANGACAGVATTNRQLPTNTDLAQRIARTGAVITAARSSERARLRCAERDCPN